MPRLKARYSGGLPEKKKSVQMLIHFTSRGSTWRGGTKNSGWWPCKIRIPLEEMQKSELMASHGIKSHAMVLATSKEDHTKFGSPEAPRGAKSKTWTLHSNSELVACQVGTKLSKIRLEMEV